MILHEQIYIYTGLPMLLSWLVVGSYHVRLPTGYVRDQPYIPKCWSGSKILASLARLLGLTWLKILSARPSITLLFYYVQHPQY